MKALLLPAAAGWPRCKPRLAFSRTSHLNFLSVIHMRLLTNLTQKRATLVLACAGLCAVGAAPVRANAQTNLPVGEDRVSSVPLVLKEGGTPENPRVFDGQGMVIDLGTDVTDQDWKKQGDLWTSNGPLLGREPIVAGQFAGLFLGDLPLELPRDVAAEKEHPEKKERCYFAPGALKPGQMGFAEDGSLYFRWPAGMEPGSARLILPPKPGISAVTVACSYITVRHITAKHASNDGFNIHGNWVGVRLEKVRAIANADEGISAHDNVEMSVADAEVAWNGSTAGGVADVNACTTRYVRCEVHDNFGAGFYLSGKSHAVSDTVIYHQRKDISVSKGTEVQLERVDWKDAR